MSDSKQFRRAISTGLVAAGLTREGNTWTHDAGAFRWIVTIDNRYWAGLAVEASLFVKLAATRDEVLALNVHLETLPIADSLEMKQALYRGSNLADEIRYERLVSLSREFGALLHSIDSPAELRRARNDGRLVLGWTSSDLEDLLRA